MKTEIYMNGEKVTWGFIGNNCGAAYVEELKEEISNTWRENGGKQFSIEDNFCMVYIVVW